MLIFKVARAGKVPAVLSYINKVMPSKCFAYKSSAGYDVSATAGEVMRDVVEKGIIPFSHDHERSMLLKRLIIGMDTMQVGSSLRVLLNDEKELENAIKLVCENTENGKKPCKVTPEILLSARTYVRAVLGWVR